MKQVWNTAVGIVLAVFFMFWLANGADNWSMWLNGPRQLVVWLQESMRLLSGVLPGSPPRPPPRPMPPVTMLPLASSAPPAPPLPDAPPGAAVMSTRTPPQDALTPSIPMFSTPLVSSDAADDGDDDVDGFSEWHGFQLGALKTVPAPALGSPGDGAELPALF